MKRKRAPRIYLAGPEVFLSDAAVQGRIKQELCAEYGFAGVFPLDAEIPRSRSPRATALKISAANEGLIRRCHAVVANLTPFRGPSADAGTVFEVGYGRARGLIVCGYSTVAKGFTARTVSASGGRRSKGKLIDRQGMSIEEFGLTDNLMIDGAIAASGGVLKVEAAPASRRFTDLRAFERCLRFLRGRFEIR